MFFRHRREVYSGYSRRHFIELRDRLQQSGIPISCRFESVNDGGRRNVITDFQMATHYHLYVGMRSRFFEKKRGKKLSLLKKCQF